MPPPPRDRREANRIAVANALAELERLTKELRSFREAEVLERRASNGGPLLEPDLPVESSPPGFPALYLGERIESAHRLALQLGGQLDRDGSLNGPVQERVAGIHEELERAARELQFLVSEAGVGFDAAAASRDVRPEWDESAEGVLPSLPSGAIAEPLAICPTGFPAASYQDYTSDRYDRTVGGLRARRRRILGWTLGLAVGISAALEVLNVLAREPMPALWLAVLPVVWLIPVPFFVLSFRGTQRILDRNHLETGVEG